MNRVGELTPEEQFSLLLDGELRPEQVAPEIASLFALTQAIDEHVTVPSPTPAFRASLRNQLVAAAAAAPASPWERARNAVWMRTANLRNSLRATIASGMAASMIGTAGVAMAAQQALPGELLYPVKELTEQVRMGLAGDLAATGRLHLRFAEERLEEVDEGAQSLRAQLLVEALDEMDDRSIAGAEDLIGWATRTGDQRVLDEVRAFTESQRDGLREVLDRLPSAVVPFAQESLEVLRRIDIELDGGTEPCDCPEDGPIVTSADPVIGAPGEAPAGTPQRPCTCTPGTDAPPPAREPGTGGDPSEPPTDGPIDGPIDQPDEPADGDPPAAEEPVDIVPELPGPLDGVGDTLDATINELLDVTDAVTDLLPLDPDDLLDPATDAVDDLLGDTSADDPLSEPLDDVVDDVADVLPSPSAVLGP